MQFMALVILFMIAFLEPRGSSSPIFYWLIFLFGSLYVFLYFPKAVEKSTIKQFRKNIAEDGNGAFIGKLVLEMDNGGITITNEHTSNMMKWSVFNRIELTDDHIFLYDSSVSAQIIPVSAFENADDKKSFYRQVEDMLK